jgi:dihydrofolate reductase
MISESARHIGIIAMTPSGIIGNAGGMPWSIPAELAHYRSVTTGQCLVMGRRTFESMRSVGASFLGQTGFILSGSPIKGVPVGFQQVASIEEYLLKTPEPQQRFVIGGAVLLHSFLQRGLIDELLISELRQEYAGDVRVDTALFESWSRTVEQEHEEFRVLKFVKPKNLRLQECLTK